MVVDLHEQERDLRVEALERRLDRAESGVRSEMQRRLDELAEENRSLRVDLQELADRFPNTLAAPGVEGEGHRHSYKDLHLGWGSRLVTIASGNITATWPYHRVAGEGGAADNLDTISAGRNGQVLFLRPDSDSVTITLRHNQSAGNDNNILLTNDADIALDDIDDLPMLIYDTDVDTNGAWVQVGGLDVGSPSGNHNLLDGSTHPDTAVDGATRGSLIYGSTAAKWDELVLGAAGSLLHSDGTDLAWATTLSGGYIFTGGVQFQDNIPAIFGTGSSDPRIYFDGTDLNLELRTATGDLKIDNSGGNAKVFVEDIDVFEKVVHITVEDPTASEDITMVFFFRAATVAEVQAVVIGSSTPSVTINPKHSTDRSAAGNALLSSATAITNTTVGQNLTAFNDATIPAASYFWLETTAQSGTVTELHISVRLTYDA